MSATPACSPPPVTWPPTPAWHPSPDDTEPPSEASSPPRSGNIHLKRALFLSAFAALRCDPTSRAYYDRKRAPGKKHNAALICLARRRCDVLHAMLRNHVPYRTPEPAAA